MEKMKRSFVPRPRPKRKKPPQVDPRPSVVGPGVAVSEAPRLDRLGRPINRNPRALCTARRTDGEPCGSYAVAGSNVCIAHGGAAPQVRRAAAVRLAMSQDWLMEKLLTIAMSEEDVKVRLDAIKTALARGGFGDRSTVEVENISKPLAPFEVALQRAQRVVRTVKVVVNEDGSETVVEAEEREDGHADLSGQQPGMVRIRRGPRMRVGDVIPAEPPAINGEVVEAEVVSDEPEWIERLHAQTPATSPPADNVVPFPGGSAMLSQTDLQNESAHQPPRRRGRGTTPTDVNM